MTSAYSGTILRIKCDFLCFIPKMPYDNRCDKSKIGTAFIVQINGRNIIVTAHHVVSNAVKVTCTSPSLRDGEARTLTIIGYNPHLDVAMMIGPDDIMSLPAFVPSPCATLAPKHSVSCIGFAGGDLRIHLTSGTISARSAFPHNRIQTDTAINPGMSGGPMLDAKRGTVIGIVTSGMDDMQATNFFTPIEEAYLSFRRIVRAHREASGRPGIDVGHVLSAVVRPIDSSACNGKEGGALVVAADHRTGLLKGDVITNVANARGEMLTINAHMRVNDQSIWKHDAVDFRSVLDTITNDAAIVSCRMVLRRNGAENIIDVNIGPSLLETRELYPDCETVVYCAFGGLIIMMLTKSHEIYTMTPSCFRNPDIELNSAPIISHVASGSPFGVHGEAPLEGAIIKEMMGANGDVRVIKTLEDVKSAIREIDPTRITLDTGHCVGAKPSELRTFDDMQTDEALRRGVHGIMRGVNSQTSFDPLEPNVVTSVVVDSVFEIPLAVTTLVDKLMTGSPPSSPTSEELAQKMMRPSSPNSVIDVPSSPTSEEPAQKKMRSSSPDPAFDVPSFPHDSLTAALTSS